MGWLGIALLVLFSLGLSLFFQFDPKRLKARPEIKDLNLWVRADDADVAPAGELTPARVLERRLFIEHGTFPRRSRLVRQERRRDPISGEVVWVGEEQVVQRWYEI